MFYYIEKNRFGVIELDARQDDNGFEHGTTWMDYLDGRWILFSQAQEAFWKSNPSASHKEIFETQLTPQPPEPTLQEYKDNAITLVEYGSVGRLNELYPPHEVAAAAWFEEDIVASVYFTEFNSARTAISSARDTARTAITNATNKAGIDAAMLVFNNSISAVE